MNNGIISPTSPGHYSSPVYGQQSNNSNPSQTFFYPNSLSKHQQPSRTSSNQNRASQINQLNQNGYHPNSANNNNNNAQVQHLFSSSNNPTNGFHNSNITTNNHHNRRPSYPSGQLQANSNQKQARLHHQHSLPSANHVREDSTKEKKSSTAAKADISLEQVKQQMSLLNLVEKESVSSVEIINHTNSLSPVYEREKPIEAVEENVEELKKPEEECKRLSDLIKPVASYRNRADYYKDVVVAVDALYPDCKWPLHNTWTFSYIKHDNSIKNWSDRIKHFMDVSYVEDFWSAANYLFNMHGLAAGGDLTCFKKGIKPEWEDDQNRMGGCWLYQMSHQQHTKIEDLWQETLMGLIGDNFCDQELAEQLDTKHDEHKDRHICEFISGTILMHRGKNEKISLWTKDYKDDHTTRLIG